MSTHTQRPRRNALDALRSPLPTIKTRMRDGLIRLRDCMGVTRPPAPARLTAILTRRAGPFVVAASIAAAAAFVGLAA